MTSQARSTSLSAVSSSQPVVTTSRQLITVASGAGATLNADQRRVLRTQTPGSSVSSPQYRGSSAGRSGTTAHAVLDQLPSGATVDDLLGINQIGRF